MNAPQPRESPAFRRGEEVKDGLGVSLPVDPCWDTSTVVLERERAVDLSDGTQEPEISQVEVRHASAERHLDAHLPWIRASRDLAARTGAQLWQKRAAICPHLQFLPRVEDDLRNLAPASIAVVRRRLIELEEAVTEWDPDTRPFPRWRGDVRREFETRRRLCWFTDFDGEERLFEWHTDFPPTPGRLHFRIVPEDRTVRVAYIGRKLGV